MSRRVRPVLAPFCALAASLGGMACTDPMPVDTSRTDAGRATVALTLNEDCPADESWLPPGGGPPPPVRLFEPAPHPDTECPFYRGAYQNFLIATAPLSSGEPAIVRYPTIDDAFISAKPNHLTRNTGNSSADPYVNVSGAAVVRKGPATGKAWLGAVRQAGQRNILVDRDHHTLYYGIHMNEAFVDFIKSNGLQTEDAIKNVDPNLQFTDGLVEFKTAWKDIDPRDFPDGNGHLGTPNGRVPPPGDGPIFEKDPGDYSNYITAMAWIPWLTQDPKTGVVREDSDHPVQRKMALVAVHSVYTLPGHPEFVWGSIQHVNIHVVDPAPVAYAGVSILGAPDTQPDTTGPLNDAGVAEPALPSLQDPQNVSADLPPNSPHNYLLYQANTPEAQANQAIGDQTLKLDESTQSFKGQQTSVYRMFPGSKSNTLQPDSAIFSLNSNINVLFSRAINSHAIDPNVDKRQHYRLVAAVWMDKPVFFGLGPDGKGMSLQNDDTSPLVIAAKRGDPVPIVSQGAFCGTPLDSTRTSGNAPNANGTNNSVPGCKTRADSLATHPPADPSGDFASHAVGTDSEFSILGGEDRLSSSAMESFTQNNTFHNCFACHNTQPITTNGTPADPSCLGPTCPAVLIPKAAKINVSHIFSEFVAREHE